MTQIWKISRPIYLILVGVLLLSACTLTIEPITTTGTDTMSTSETANSQELFAVPPAEISAKMPYETQYVEVLGSQMAYVAAAVLAGGNVRVGLEDNLMLDRGVLATNAQLVERAANIIQNMGARVIGPQEVRTRLGLNKRQGGHAA